MKQFLHLILFLFISLKSYSQPNLIPNGDFENISACPDSLSKISLAQPWFRPTNGTTDLFAQCNINNIVGVPQNNMGFQAAQSSNNYIGLYLTNYDNSPWPIPEILEYKEYASVKLIEPLIGGNIYCLNMYVSLADNDVNAAISKIGAYFSVNAMQQNNTSFLNVSPQIESNQGYIIDKENWVLVSGSFIATGGEEYITIGNFHDANSTDYILFDTTQLAGYAYYYVDNISLVCCDSVGCELKPIVPNVFTPNNDGYNDSFVIPILPPKSQLIIYNRWGNIVYENNNYQNDWNGSDCSDGVYYYIITTPYNKQYKGTVTILR